MLRPRREGPLYLASIALDPNAGLPLNRQLYFALREGILDARLRPGARLPSSRALANDLSVSRNTVLAAFEQLLAEGYIDGRVGAGSFVSKHLPEEALHARKGLQTHVNGTRPPGPSSRGAALAALPSSGGVARAFAPGVPELAAFPFEHWSRLLAKYWRNPPKSFLIGSEAAGYGALREALAAHLGAARAVRCSPKQVFIVSGAQQALDLVARTLLDVGDRVWVEDPGYPGLIGALLASAAEITEVPVDQDGLVVADGCARSPNARMACVSPSHQYPLGVTMSLSRRLELLAWARENDAFVLEDDYDSEYRYAGRPLAALQGLDSDGRVIYVGTMSKVMFPGLRLGYMVVPEHLVPAFEAIRRLTDTHPSTLAQPALAEFITDGTLAAHIRRMRALYAKRQRQFIDIARSDLSDLLEIGDAEAGMHLVGCLQSQVSDVKVAEKARELGIEAPALSTYYRSHQPKNGLLLGYAGVTENEIRRGINALKRAIEAVSI